MQPRDASPAQSTARQTLLWILKIGVSAGLLYVLFTRIDVGHMWRLMRGASLPWILAALGLYLVMVLVSTWRWRLLLHAQHVSLGFGKLFNSYLVAIFANNFLPSNIGGDVVRIRDTAPAAGSKTLATAVVLADRGVGVLGLAFVAACGSTMTAHRSEALGSLSSGLLWTGLASALTAVVLILAMPERLGALLRPLRVFHAEWVDKRIAQITDALLRFQRAPIAMVIGFLGAIIVQCVLVAFYAAVAAALHITVPLGHLAILVPVSFIVQMMPLSVNGLGVREATFGIYFKSIGLALESAIALSFIGAALIMLFSMSGAGAYLARRKTPARGTNNSELTTRNWQLTIGYRTAAEVTASNRDQPERQSPRHAD